MTPKEALDYLVKNLPVEAQQTTSIYHTAIRVLLQALTELGELKRDVARYFELSHNPKTNTNSSEMRPYIEWAEELTDLELHILSKVGKEE
jgi:hypothetical protein